jgi:L-seryl-tRNA(Ser) seleniumtransferase
MSNALRSLPAVHEVLAVPSIKTLLEEHGQAYVTELIRGELESLRSQIREQPSQCVLPSTEAIASRVTERLAATKRLHLRRVINATGILLHTNLGRAPLAEHAAKAAFEAGCNYLNLEMDLETGKRSSRQMPIASWMCRLLKCQAATVVNNNAAATVIVLRALAKGKEVLVSRGQLVEIGGSFRIPDIMAVSGAQLREVGTTNITRVQDYESAITGETAALLKVHCSNYRIHGHVASASLEELVALARRRSLLVIDDIGSGALVDYSRWGLSGEPLASESLAVGADLVLFSGDKLLGGPQAGIIAGRADLIAKVEKDPLMRAFRCDKMTLAALEATLRIYLTSKQPVQDVPILRMLETPIDVLRARAESLAQEIAKVSSVSRSTAEPCDTFVGGGSLPEQRLPSWVVTVETKDVTDADLAYRLRIGTPAVVARVQNGRLIMDLRTVFSDQDASLLEALRLALCQQR